MTALWCCELELAGDGELRGVVEPRDEPRCVPWFGCTAKPSDM